MFIAYCLKCKIPTKTKDSTLIFDEKRKTFRVKGTCTECGTKKSTFVDKNQSKQIK